MDHETGESCETALTDTPDLGSCLTLDYMFESYYDQEDFKTDVIIMLLYRKN